MPNQRLNSIECLWQDTNRQITVRTSMAYIFPVAACGCELFHRMEIKKWTLKKTIVTFELMLYKNCLKMLYKYCEQRA